MAVAIHTSSLSSCAVFLLSIISLTSTKINFICILFYAGKVDLLILASWMITCTSSRVVAQGTQRKKKKKTKTQYYLLSF